MMFNSIAIAISMTEWWMRNHIEWYTEYLQICTVYLWICIVYVYIYWNGRSEMWEARTFYIASNQLTKRVTRNIPCYMEMNIEKFNQMFSSLFFLVLLVVFFCFSRLWIERNEEKNAHTAECDGLSYWRHIPFKHNTLVPYRMSEHLLLLLLLPLPLWYCCFIRMHKRMDTFVHVIVPLVLFFFFFYSKFPHRYIWQT